MRLKKYLLEMTVGRPTNDMDFPYETKTALVFSKDEEYKIDGKTHGIVSHIIKHFGEFFESKISTIKDKMKDLFSSTKNPLYLKDFGSNHIEENPSLGSIDIDVWLTTLDLIQDKVINRKPIKEIEKNAYKVFYDLFVHEYLNIADHLKKNSFIITEEMEDLYTRFKESGDEKLSKEIDEYKKEIATKKIVQFNILSRGIPRVLIYDLTSTVLLVLEGNGDTILTMHQLIKTISNPKLKSNKSFVQYSSGNISFKEATYKLLNTYNSKGRNDIPETIYSYLPK